MKKILSQLIIYFISMSITIFVGGWLVTTAWNGLIPDIFSTTSISYLQGCKIMLLGVVVASIMRLGTVKNNERGD